MKFEGGPLAYLFKAAFCIGSRVKRPASAIDTTNCILMSSILSNVCELRKFFRQNAYSFAPGVFLVRFQEQYALYTVRRSESPVQEKSSISLVSRSSGYRE